MDKITEKAVEGGYDIDNGYIQNNSSLGRDRFAILDPLFWSALGKSCGWNGMLLEYAPIDGSLFEPNEWIQYAGEFFMVRMTMGEEKSIEYLNSVLNYQ